MVAYVVNLEKASPTAAQAALGQVLLEVTLQQIRPSPAQLSDLLLAPGDATKGALGGAGSPGCSGFCGR